MDATESKLRFRISCECGAEYTGEADSYPEAWNAMDEWKRPHNTDQHPNRGKPFDHYRWREDVRVVGDRTPFDGLQPIPEEQWHRHSRMRELLGLPQR